LSKSKFRLLSIISTNNLSEVEINFYRNSDRNSDEINFGGNPTLCLALTRRVTICVVRAQGTEKKLRAMVTEYGAVITTLYANAAYRKYKKGVFAGCTKEEKGQAANHVVAVVGYGKDAATGKAFWLLKNSRGAGWGEQGSAWDGHRLS
jgi:hypothetical protein